MTRPHTDPYSAALAALLVADFVKENELGRMARMMLSQLSKLGGTYLPEEVEISPELMERGASVRQATLVELEKAIPKTKEIAPWIAAVKKGHNAVDLVFDLRTLADLVRAHNAILDEQMNALPPVLSAASDAIEAALRTDETEEQKKRRDTIAAIWADFVPAYERAAAMARDTTRTSGAELTFPPLGLIAANHRAKRRGDSGMSISPMSAMPQSLQASLQTGKYEIVGHVDIHRSEPPQRQVSAIDLEVGITSESNFYVGFTEDLTVSGVFVATYASRPIGSKLVITLSMPSGETMKLPGTVKWTRAASEDGWPGMGVEFEKLSLEDEMHIQKFISLREPLFFDA